MVQDQPELCRISFSPLASTGILNCKSWSGAERAHIDMLNLELINTSVSPQRQPAENQKNIRSHTACQSNSQRCLQNSGIASPGSIEGARWVVYRSVPAAVPNGTPFAGYDTKNLVGLTQLQFHHSLSKTKQFRGLALHSRRQRGIV